jgi:hypothetical protein
LEHAVDAACAHQSKADRIVTVTKLRASDVEQ